MKKILILGANGGTGKYLVDYFVNHPKEEFKVIGAGRHDCAFVQSKIDYIHMDICKKKDFDKLPDDIHTIILLAGAMPARMEGYNPELYIQTNILGTMNVLNYCVEKHVDRILFTQSFGDIKNRAEKELVLTPFMSPDFDYNTDHSVYVVSKNTAVELLKCYHAIHNLKTFIFRLPTVYSWSRNDSFYVNGVKKKRAWRYMIDRAMSGQDLEVWGNPNRSKDMVYVKDLCQMLYLATFVDRDFGYYNVGTGVGTTLLEQAQGMIEVFGEGKGAKIVMRPDKPDAPQYIMSIDNAREELGYKPVYSYLEMLKDMKEEMHLDRF